MEFGMVTFSHVIHYVDNVEKTLEFYKTAFQLEVAFLHESGQYAELSTGTTHLAFASSELGKMNLPSGYLPLDPHKPPFASEIVFTCPDVTAAYKRVLDHGAVNVAGPVEKPWGQTVAYVRDPFGILIELASEMK